MSSTAVTAQRRATTTKNAAGVAGGRLHVSKGRYQNRIPLRYKTFELKFILNSHGKEICAPLTGRDTSLGPLDATSHPRGATNSKHTRPVPTATAERRLPARYRNCTELACWVAMIKHAPLRPPWVHRVSRSLKDAILVGLTIAVEV